MRRVAVTGGIGTGKSVVCRMFSMLGIPVYDSDSMARSLMDSDRELISELTDAFGARTYSDGSLDRKYLASVVFADRERLRQLDGIVHPAVMRHFGQWACSMEANGAPYVIMESAILFDAGLQDAFDRIVAVLSPLEVRIERAMARDGATREQVLSRISSQLPESEVARMADTVIRKDCGNLVWPQIIALDRALRS